MPIRPGKKWIAKLRQRLNLETTTAYLGDGAGDVRDRSKPGYYYVRFPQANGTYTKPVSLRAYPNANLPPTDGLPVIVGYDASGTQIILQANVQALQETGANPIQFNPLDNQYSRFVNQNQITTFYATRHSDVDNNPFYAVVFPGFYFTGSGELDFFAGGSIDLSSLQPSSGNHCYVAVFLKKDDGTLEAFASTSIDTGDPLSILDIQEVVALKSATSLDIWAWELSGDDTALTVDPARSKDLRHPFDGFGDSAARNKTITITAATYTAANIPTILADATSNAITVSLPTAASAVDRVYNILKKDAGGNTVTVDGDGSETINGDTTQVLASQYDSITIQSDGTEWFII